MVVSLKEMMFKMLKIVINFLLLFKLNYKTEDTTKTQNYLLSVTLLAFICSKASVIFNGLSLTVKLFKASSRLVAFTFLLSLLCFLCRSLTVSPNTSPRSPKSLLYLNRNGKFSEIYFWIKCHQF